MSKEEKKTRLRDLQISDEHLGTPESRRTPSLETPKKIRRVQPVGMRILVRIQDDSNVTDGGLYLPEGAKSNMQESVLAEVIEVASALDDQSNEEANISGIPLGAIILIGKESGVRVPWNDKLRIVDSKDVLATLAEVNLS